MEVFHQLVGLAVRADFTARVAQAALDGHECSELSPHDVALDGKGPHIAQLRKNAQTLLEMVLTRLVDHFDTYLSGVIREVLSAQPALLKSAEQVRLDYALAFSSMGEFRSALIERKVQDLGYLGFAELSQWYIDRLGLPLALNDEESQRLVELIETRNLIVHNRGIVGEKYLRLVKQPQFELGERRHLNVDGLFATQSMLLALVVRVDAQLCEKFRLAVSECSGAKGTAV